MRESGRKGARRARQAMVMAAAGCLLGGTLFAAPLAEVPVELAGTGELAPSSGTVEVPPSATSAAAAGQAERLDVLAFQPICGEQRSAPGLADDVVDEVRVHVTLRNARRMQVPARDAVLVLKSRNGAEQRRTVRVPPVAASGSVSIEGAFPFPADPAQSYERVALIQPGESSPEFEPIEFACVRKCPPNAVVVRVCRNDDCSAGAPGDAGIDCAEAASQCPTPRGRWTRELAACSRDRVYCSYTWETRGFAGDLEPAEPNFRLFDGYDAEVDCSVVSAQALDPASSDELLAEQAELSLMAEVTGQQLEVPGLDAFLAGPNVPASQPVQLAVLDTAAVPFTSASPDDNSDHGRLVGLIAERVACGDEKAGACPVRIDNRLALPIVELERDTGRWSMDLDLERGGHLAGRAQVATAITRLLQDRKASAPPQGSPVPLVMNLSFGWHSKHDCQPAGCGDAIHVDRPSEALVPDGLLAGLGSTDGDGISRSLASEAILLAIARARCEGALIFAAAGNAVTDDEVGATLPGAWNRLPASKLDCEATFDIKRTGLSGGLVAAVAAVDHAGARTGLMRVGSLPPFTALGIAVAARDERAPFGVRGPRSGSSFATAVASGTAARLWAHLGPATPAEEVARLLYNAGVPLTRTKEGVTQSIDAQLCAGRGECELGSVKIGACSALRALVNDKRIPAAALPAECAAAALPPDPSGEGAAPWVSADGSTMEEPKTATVDALEASWVLPQPWGVKCATCQDQFSEAAFPQWKSTFSGAYVDGSTLLIEAFYRVSVGQNLLSERLPSQLIARVSPPPGYCTEYPNNCWRVQGTVGLDNWPNSTEAAARLEVRFQQDSNTATGSASPFASDAITRLSPL